MREHLESAISRLPFFPIDAGGPNISVLLVGMGRSGTTWAGNLINYDRGCRMVFEPFFPARVRAARRFEYLQYLHPDYEDPVLAGDARKILAGNVRSRWIDRENDRWRYRCRMLKDIRCNLMVGWLRRIANDPPVVVVVRHPLQVVASWARLGWGREAVGQRTDFDIITSQTRLIEDFPMVSELSKGIDREDFMERTLFQWCVFHLVPMTQLVEGEAYALFYENLLLNFDGEVSHLMQYLGRPFEAEAVRRAASGASTTNFQKRNFADDKSGLLDGWKQMFSKRQIGRAQEILSAFGLDEIYDDNGRPSGIKMFNGPKERKDGERST